jgi:hypothetical protein
MHQGGEDNAIETIVNALHDRVVWVEFSAREICFAPI